MIPVPLAQNIRNGSLVLYRIGVLEYSEYVLQYVLRVPL
jgi:hypothetical protein